MKQDLWKQFIWNLSVLRPAASHSELPAGLMFRPAERHEETVVQALVARAFSFDDQLSGSYRRIADPLGQRIHQAFRSQEHAAVAVLHGPRMIAVACLSTDSDSGNHLLSGPCVLPEYRSRGLGSALLLHSLDYLRRAGLHVARAICKEGTTVSRYIYPKFGGFSSPCPESPFPTSP
jgi:GNAT superfamily N-acetyltransferase